MSGCKASYLDLPLELREQILAYCTRSTLAALTTTAKLMTAEAEAMLYEVVSLHEERRVELDGCLRTLTGVWGSDKARLVRTFAVTFVRGRNNKDKKRHERQIKACLTCIQVVLPNMTGLKVLSVWPPEKINTIGIEQLLREQHFQLERLYIDAIEDIPRLLKCQPRLETILLWLEWRYYDDSKLDEKRAELKRSLAHFRARMPPLHELHCGAQPIIIALDSDDDLRSLTVFYSPRSYHESVSPQAATFDTESARNYQELLLPDGNATNVFLSRRILEDLELSYDPDREENLCFLLPELSTIHIMWTLRTFSQLATMYPMDVKGARMPFITLFVVDFPKLSTDMSPVYEPFKKLVTALINLKVDDLEVRRYFKGTTGMATEDGSIEVLFDKLSSIVREAVDERKPGSNNSSFWFTLEDEYENFPFP